MQLLRASLLTTALLSVATAQTASWSQLQVATAPALQFQLGSLGSTAAYDASRQRVVLIHWNGNLETWELTGNQWQLRQVLPPLSGSLFGWSNLVWDEVAQRVFFTLVSSTGWQIGEWDGTTWTPRTVPLPAPDFRMRLVRDPVRQRTVLVCGLVAPTAFEWDGQTWRSIAAPPLNGPLGFDATRGEVVCPAIGTMYAYDGLTWRDLVVPSPQLTGKFVQDPLLQRLLLLDFRTGTDLVHQWDGTSWDTVTQFDRPPFLFPERALTFDAQRGALVMVGDLAGYTTWLLREVTGSPAAFLPFGAGCQNSAGAPILSALGRPVLGRTLNMQIGNVGSGALAFAALGTSTTTWNGQSLPLDLGQHGAPGCWLHLAPASTIPVPSTGGTASWALPIPASLNLIGVAVHAQAGASTPTAFATSNAATLVIGPH